MTDIVYLLGSGSQWENNEIRYSLRSVEKHLSGVGKLYVIGYCPDFLDAVHVAVEDFPNANLTKAVNIKNKIVATCGIHELSDKFLVFSDDYFLLKDFPAGEYPYFYRGTLEEGMRQPAISSLYRRVYGNTIKVLNDHNLPTKHFNVHAPILYDKTITKQAFEIADWNTMLGFMSKSIYCNYTKQEGVYQTDCKLSIPMSKESIEQTIQGRPFFSISDRALLQGKMINMNLVAVLENLYPKKSRWEK